MPLSPVEISYQAIHMASKIHDWNLYPQEDYDQFTSPIWEVNPPTSNDLFIQFVLRMKLFLKQ